MNGRYGGGIDLIHLLFSDGRMPGVPPSPAIRASRVASAMIRAVCLSRHAHCMVGDDDTVLDPALSGDRTLPLDRVLECYPGLTALIVFDASLPFPIAEICRPHDRGFRCARTASRVLRLASIESPAFRTPSSLYHWSLDNHV